MATTKFYLDCRSGNNPYPLKLTITHARKSVQLSLGVKIAREQWDGNKVVKHPKAQMLNTQLAARKAEIDCQLLEWEREGKLRGVTVKTLKVMIEGENTSSNNFAEFFRRVAHRHSASTAAVYERALKAVLAYDTSASFDTITLDWLIKFDTFMAETMPSANTRSIILRSLRAVFNAALDEELTTNYPFRKFKIKQTPTAKRSMTLEDIKELMRYEVEHYQERYRDLFILMLIMRGINIGDLCLLAENNIVDGRIEYIRQKTGKQYSIKMEPEISELIEKYKGKNYLINVCDDYKDYRDFKSRMNKGLKRIGVVEVGKRGKKTIKARFPYLSTYWARHTFATIAYNECRIPIDIISDMLGHSNGLSTTNIYIRRDNKAADKAARKVIDKIYYGK